MKFHNDGTLPNSTEIFVFGSNMRGAHGAGAAKVAVDKYNAEHGVYYGITGKSFAIPTKDYYIKTMELENIIPFIKKFVSFTREHTDKQFFVTRIGCVLAGYSNEEIAPHFKGCGDNCSFALQWKEYLL